MKYYSTPSFIRRFKKLDSNRKKIVNDAIRKVLDLYNIGLNPKGLGLKQLRTNLWEIRSSLQERILFSFDNDTIRFTLIGDHDEIRRFLKNL
jgi:mRNA-degrading endonuclease RelE of RelBE toxin-antitoxin system